MGWTSVDAVESADDCDPSLYLLFHVDYAYAYAYAFACTGTATCHWQCFVQELSSY